MRKVLTAAFAMAVAMAATGPASAEPASSSSAAAFGLAATVLGVELVPPTPAVAVSQPPDTGQTLGDNINTTLPVEVPGVAVTGVVVAVGDAHRADDIVPALTTLPASEFSDPITLTGVNSRGLARTTGLSVLASVDVSLLEILTGPVVQQGLVNAGVIQAEAVAKCVNNQPVFDTGYNIVDLNLAGSELLPLNTIVGDLLTLLDLEVLGLVDIEIGETGTLPGGGVFVNALRISSPLLGADIVVSHAEAAMPANCGIAPPAPPTGPGPVAPLGTLAATGNDFSVTPLVAMALLGGALGVRRVTMRARRSSSTVA